MLESLYNRNSVLFIFGCLLFLGALVSAVLIYTTHKEVMGINAWIKPFKFFLSGGIFVWTMAWLLHYLTAQGKVTVFNWVVVAVLAFETGYIAWQAARGQLSHFNISTPFHSIMYSVMGVAITVMTLWTGYIGYLFFTSQVVQLPPADLWGIRLGIGLFVLFALQGGIMGAMMRHTVGAADGGNGLPLVNWSRTNGDLRIAHFTGMHALQLLPLAGFYITKTPRQIMIIAAVYFLTTVFVLVQALLGKPFLQF